MKNDKTKVEDQMKSISVLGATRCYPCNLGNEFSSIGDARPNINMKTKHLMGIYVPVSKAKKVMVEKDSIYNNI
jgi:hypothetical protein